MNGLSAFTPMKQMHSHSDSITQPYSPHNRAQAPQSNQEEQQTGGPFDVARGRLAIVLWISWTEGHLN